MKFEAQPIFSCATSCALIFSLSYPELPRSLAKQSRQLAKSEPISKLSAKSKQDFQEARLSFFDDCENLTVESCCTKDYKLLTLASKIV